MKSSDARNLLIAIIILAIGIKVIIMIFSSYLANINLQGLNLGLTGSIESIGNLMIYALAFIAVIVFFVYLSARSGSKKPTPQPSPVAKS